jgi:hypothetical protein
MSDARIQRCLEPGVSVIVGSVDTLGNPACCRGVGLRSDDDLASVTVYLPVATSQETIANVAANGRLAVVTAHPLDHCATQLKGIVSTTRLARDDEEPFVRGHLGGFGSVLNKIGYPPRLTKAIRHWPAFALEMKVDEIFEQTPGPRAGTRLR